MNKRLYIAAALVAAVITLGWGGRDDPAKSAVRQGPDPPTAKVLLRGEAVLDETDADQLPVFETIAEKVSPAVVHLVVERQEPADPSAEKDFWDELSGGVDAKPGERYTVEGTGFFIRPDGTLVTDFHVVQHAILITVFTSDGKEFTDTKILGRDLDTDLAVLKVEGTDLPFVPLGDSETLHVGDYVMAIGNPYGLENTATLGICSGKQRQLGTTSFQRFIQTDASINQGNSGGPLLNSRGEVVGVNASVLSRGGANLGIGFATPTVIANRVINDILDHGRVVRGWLGAKLQDITAGIQRKLKLPDHKGALVVAVLPGGAAEKSGLRTYDVVVAADGETVYNQLGLDTFVSMTEPGRNVRFDVIRDGGPVTLVVKLDERPEPRWMAVKTPIRPQDSAGKREIGITVTRMTDERAHLLGFEAPEGLLITGVRESSEAARHGLRKDMVIVEVNRQKVRTTVEFDKVWKGLPVGEEIMLLVRYLEDGEVRQSIILARVV